MKYSIITISREYGSGGRLIAETLSQKLGIPCYDKRLIDLTAKGADVSAEYVKTAEDKRPNILYNLCVTADNLPVDDQVYVSQCRVIQNIAQKGACIIVGRCADYVLHERTDCLRVFVYAPLKQRMERIMNVYGDTEHALEIVVKKRDKNRAEYYNYYANSEHRWGDRQNYNLMIDTSIGLNESCALILSAFNGEVI
ncbi:AAA family ATPase [Blautia producta]|uniref:Cytidylate kinase n=1 Tax=Blautia producta TaxID=33035 RepID=A0A4P6M1I5_9FIRM|nr:cytidylate kinase-like family protein [Blautia producta]QBE97313.1 Cytidylate kinase [Blautia producta]